MCRSVVFLLGHISLSMITSFDATSYFFLFIVTLNVTYSSNIFLSHPVRYSINSFPLHFTIFLSREVKKTVKARHVPTNYKVGRQHHWGTV